MIWFAALFVFLLVSAVVLGHARMKAAAVMHPPLGQFLQINGVRLHYTDQGQGDTFVILHGNGGMAEEIRLSGLDKALARTHRVLVFDRPGFGHSSRPSRLKWTAQEQASLILQALDRLNVPRAVVIGHSWGTLVAVAMAVQEPQRVQRLVLMSGYYFPIPHRGAQSAAVLCRPVIGHFLRHAVLPLLGDGAMWRIIRNCFAPERIPPAFYRFPVSLALRPSQVFAGAEDGTTMQDSARQLAQIYPSLAQPVLVLTGDGDRVITCGDHSIPLHAALPNSRLVVLQGVGHMPQHTQLERVLAEIGSG
jgi:pimeloyl-ACP methyl ester carboxylesterase